MAEKVITRDVVHDLETSYLDYAMDVIIDRALPDIRDGCKPVHRRILYAMYETGNTCKKPYKKSARTVGEVLGKTHPHGDSSVYGAMVRMAQDFSLRYPLVDGHGNFGSIDGDTAAAMRYTEARMSKLADTMLEDIDKDTVNMMKNYDDTLWEPRVLPAKLPNLLVNGTDGIAVGFATKMPPHNLTEVLNGIIAKIDDPMMDSEGLMKYIKGPDFPGGGTIQGVEGIRDMYLTGKGKITVKADYVIEDAARGRKQIVFVNVPYQVVKADEVAKIEKLCTSHIEKDKKTKADVRVKAVIDDVVDIRDETSAKDGVRIVVEVKRSANVKKIVREIYKRTGLQSNFNANMLALQPLANNRTRPHQFTLVEMVDAYIDHRKEVVTRKYTYLLKKAEARKHIIDGLIVAVNAIDDVVKTIRQSKDKATACKNLCDNFELDETQALAVLEYRLQSLTGLEVNKLEEELDVIKRSIETFKTILSSEQNVLKEVKKDCKDMLKNYSDERITKIATTVEDDDDANKETENIEDKEMVVIISDSGYIKSVPLNEFTTQRRGGKGVKGVKAANTDVTKQLISTNKRNILLCFGSDGKAYKLPVNAIEEVSRTARGQYLNNLISVPNDVEIVTVIGVNRTSDGEPTKGVVLLFTERGEAKKIKVSEFIDSKYNCLMAVKIKEDDRIINAIYSETETGLAYVATKNGKLLKFDYEHYRCKGRNSSTNKCITLLDGDYVIGADIISENDSILTVTNTGMGKKSLASNYRLAGVGGQGLLNYKTSKDVFVVAAITIKEDNDILVACDNGKLIRIQADTFRNIGRNSKGVNLVSLEGTESVVGVSAVIRENTSDKDDDSSEETAEE